MMTIPNAERDDTGPLLVDAVQLLVDALVTAQNGLKWYRAAHPADVDGSDDEMDVQIDTALDAARVLQAPIPMILHCPARERVQMSTAIALQAILTKAQAIWDSPIDRHLLKMEVGAIAAFAREALQAPIPMILHCPACKFQHIDKPDPAVGWLNEPHRSHKCGACGHIWRPCDLPTAGVAAIQTRGQKDSA